MIACRAYASWLLLLVATLTLAGPPAAVADGSTFKAHMAFLADDLLEGRESGTRGFDIAARYVAGQFAQYGVQAKGDLGNYLQAVPLKSGLLVRNSAVLEIRRKGGVEALTHLDEILHGAAIECGRSRLCSASGVCGIWHYGASVQA